MNRVVPLAFGRSITARYPLDVDHAAAQEEGGGWSDDFRLFATAWAAGLVFFGTFLS